MTYEYDQTTALTRETLDFLKERAEEIQFQQELQSLDYMDAEDYAFYLANGSFDR